jgi:hypothetical protein
MKTNIDELVKNLQGFFSEAMKTNTFVSYAQKAGDSMKDHVIAKARGNGEYSFIQSGRLMRTLKTNDAEVKTNKTGSKATIGYGYVDDFNQQTKRGAQVAITRYGQEIGLRPEPSLPDWIIVEFGRKPGVGVSAGNIPSEFQVSYVARDPNKQFVTGPFQTLYHMRKPIFFMTSYKNHGVLSNGMGVAPRTHPGIHEGRIFRDGLANSKESINQYIGEGLYESTKELSRKYGGTVERL